MDSISFYLDKTEARYMYVCLLFRSMHTMKLVIFEYNNYVVNLCCMFNILFSIYCYISCSSFIAWPVLWARISVTKEIKARRKKKKIKKNWYRQMKQMPNRIRSMCDAINSEMDKSLITIFISQMDQLMRATNSNFKETNSYSLLSSLCECSCENVQFKCNH